MAVTIAPWIRPTDVLAAIEGGSRAGIASKEANQHAIDSAASHEDAAQKLRLAYTSLAAEQDQARQRAAAQKAQTDATLALRSQQQNALAQYRQQQEQNAAKKIADQEAATAAADTLKKHQETAATGFLKDINSGKTPVEAMEANPGVPAAVAHPILSAHYAQQRQEQSEWSKDARASLVKEKPISPADKLKYTIEAAKLLRVPAGSDADDLGYRSSTNAAGILLKQLQPDQAPELPPQPDKFANLPPASPPPGMPMTPAGLDQSVPTVKAGQVIVDSKGKKARVTKDGELPTGYTIAQ